MILELRRELDRIERSIAILEGFTRVALGQQSAHPLVVCVKGVEHSPPPLRSKVMPIQPIRNCTKDS
jgi:hypothetical protein